MANNASDEDDPEISSSAILWRRIPPWHYRFDDNCQDYRPSTAAFEDDQDGDSMSAYLADECGDPALALEGHEGFGLVAITAETVRRVGMKIVRRDVPGPPGHVVIVGKKTDGVRKRLKIAAEWVVRARPSDS